MRIRKLHEVFKDLDDETLEVNQDSNEEAYAELVQLLDDRSLSLVIREAKDSGRKALRIL